ncbi:hypothetical protein FRC07_014584 [Ceratobasidium sp. 392]|nr:hypothetical protein FRC07_014584 [Ceratobasidium sp. 392]
MAFLRQIHSAADLYTHVAFAKVDADAVPDVAKNAMPTFLFIKNKTVVETVRGGDKTALENALRTHSPPAPPPTSLGEGPSKDESAASQDVSLLEYLDSTQLNCLNESDTHNIKSILGNKVRNTGKSYLETDATYAPKTIKLAINRPALGFEDVESAAEPEMAQLFEQLSPEDIAQGRRIPLRFVRFQSVTSLHIFVASNQGGEDETRINAIDVFGQPVETTKMAGLRQTDD